jgi:hypothetical protein
MTPFVENTFILKYLFFPLGRNLRSDEARYEITNKQNWFKITL